MTMPPSPQQVSPDASRDQTERWFGAADATAIRPEGGGPLEGRPALSARAAAATRGHARGGQTTLGLERRQRAGLCGGPQTF